MAVADQEQLRMAWRIREIPGRNGPEIAHERPLQGGCKGRASTLIDAAGAGSADAARAIPTSASKRPADTEGPAPGGTGPECGVVEVKAADDDA